MTSAIRRDGGPSLCHEPTPRRVRSQFSSVRRKPSSASRPNIASITTPLTCHISLCVRRRSCQDPTVIRLRLSCGNAGAEELRGIAGHWRYRARAGVYYGEICRARAIRPRGRSAVRTSPNWRCRERWHCANRTMRVGVTVAKLTAARTATKFVFSNDIFANLTADGGPWPRATSSDGWRDAISSSCESRRVRHIQRRDLGQVRKERNNGHAKPPQPFGLQRASWRLRAATAYS
jgi:hypothetical protein